MAELDGTEKDWLEGALDDPRVTNRGLARELTRRGHAIDEASVRRWRDNGQPGQKDAVHPTIEERPAVLVLDTETSPLIGYTWGIFDQNVIEVLQDWQILTVSYRWWGDGETQVVQQCDLDGYAPGELDDRSLVEHIWRLLDAADYLVCHNVAFDERKINARFLVHGLPPPSPYKAICTLRTARKHARFTTNRLGDLGEALGLGDKEQSGGFDTWRGCLEGRAESWEAMRAYSERDVDLLVAVWERLLPWVPSINAGLWLGGMACPACGHRGLEPSGAHRTSVSTYAAWRCRSCGRIARERRASKDEPSPILR